MASKRVGLFVLLQLLVLNVVSQTSAFPTPTASADDKTVYNRQLTEERPLQEQIAEADSVKAAVQSAESKQPATSKDAESEQGDDFTMLKSLADGQKSKEAPEGPVKEGDRQYVPDESDSTKSRRLADDYDSTKNGMDYGKYQDDPESFRQVDGTPLSAEDIVQKIANKIYEEDDRGVFDRIVSKLLKLGLITENQADTLEYQVAEALQDLITKNAKNNEVEDMDQESRGEQDDLGPDTDAWETPRRRYDEEDDDEVANNDDEIADEVDRDVEEDVDNSWDKEKEEGNEVNPEDGLQDLQYFPNFYRLLKSLDSEQDAQERETLITIMKTLIDFVKMMVKYGTITPEEGVSYLENLDAMIAMQTKNKLGKSLVVPDISGLTGKNFDEDDNTKSETAKMQKEYENLKDSTKEEQTSTDTNQPGKSESYLEAIRKNIEWLKKHNKEEGKNDYDLSKLKDFMDQQVDSYIEKGIIAKDEGDTIKRIYSSL
ncbi:secretogranin-3 isoform X1 [Xiphophorus hellerii]|uniref:secretogranin-3 isoform X1 n=1 Tax=Xiphophorus hellerii TaxID=8084 RepID=UPI0013B3DD90|nr:secretogranin-3 isoform X1 [Xiphophorus hellerii]XP_032417030.1 secretogranin-3 isoform X1 [Xiphophorus hellerii]